MNIVDIVGSLAAFTSMISLIPQIVKVIKTHSTEDLSYLMLFNFLLTSLLWVCYGTLISSVAVWLCNLFMTLTALILLVFKHRFG